MGLFIIYTMLAGIVVFNSSYTHTKVNKLPRPMSEYVLGHFVFTVILLQVPLAIVGMIVLCNTLQEQTHY